MNGPLRDTIVRLLSAIAPEADTGALDPDADLREQLDIDSMDHLNFVIALSRETGLEIPEVDYPQLTTLSGAIAYIEARSTV